jgi:hypothetical protein
MATLSVQTQDRTGLNPTTQAAEAGGDDFANDGRTYLYVNNTDGSPHDVQPDAVVQAFGHRPRRGERVPDRTVREGGLRVYRVVHVSGRRDRPRGGSGPDGRRHPQLIGGRDG